MDSWELYECAIDDHRAFVAVDVELYDQAPDGALPHTIRVVVPLLHPRADGLPDTPERPRLDAMESDIVGIMETIGAIHVGRASFGGAVRHYFYAPGADAVDDAAECCIAAVTDRKIEVGSYHDPDWQQYFDFLYPNPLGWQWILDRRTLDALVEQGDDLGLPRPIDHHASFETAAGRDAFANAVSALGYQIAERGVHDDESDGVRVFTLDFATAYAPVAIFPVTIELFRLAEACGGTYDGWMGARSRGAQADGA